jgi:hypothetical protein
MPESDSNKTRETWAKRNAQLLVDGILGVSERSGWPYHPTPDQVALLREIARRALWHMPNSGDEVCALVRHFDIENLRKPHPGDDAAPEESPRL